MRYIIISSLLLGAGLIVLLSLGASNTEFFADNLPLLLGMTALAALALAILFGFQVYSLWRRIRSGVFGSRLTARLFWTLGLMSLIPGLIVYGVSVQFIVRSIESWFDVRVEQALESGLALGQSALEHLERDHIKKAEVIAQQLGKYPGQITPENLSGLTRYAAYARLLIDGMPSNPFSLQTLPPCRESFDPERAEIIRRVSRRRFAQGNQAQV